MKTSNNKPRVILFTLGALVLLCVGIVLGGAIGYVVGRNSTSSPAAVNVPSQVRATRTPKSQISIVGKWFNAVESTTKDIEFFEDGSVSINSENVGKYTLVSANQISIETKDGNTIYTYKITADSLTLTNEQYNVALLFNRTATSSNSGPSNAPAPASASALAKRAIYAMSRNDLAGVRILFAPDKRDEITSLRSVSNHVGVPGDLTNCKEIGFETVERQNPDFPARMWVTLVFQSACAKVLYQGSTPSANKVIVDCEMISGQWYLRGLAPIPP